MQVKIKCKMDNHGFEQVIDLKDNPSVRKQRSPEMNELHKQGLFSHLFSIEEEVPLPRVVCNRNRIIISATSVLAMASLIVTLTIFTWRGETSTSHDQSRVNKTSAEDIDITFQPTTEIDAVMIPTTEQALVVCPNYTLLDDQVQGCISSPLSACRSINLCETFLPNRFCLAESLTELQERYNDYITNLNLTCHPYARRFLCSRVSPPCPKTPIHETPEPFYAFDVINFPYEHVPVPCKSLCENISETCIEDEMERLDMNGFCTILPESTSDDICFGGALTTVPLCQSFTCENGGTCFIVSEQQYCKCQPGYFGTHCEIHSSADHYVTQGQCVSVPEQCRSVLPYNTTRGLNLTNSHLSYIAFWERITPVAYEGIKDTRIPIWVSSPAEEMGDKHEER